MAGTIDVYEVLGCHKTVTRVSQGVTPIWLMEKELIRLRLTMARRVVDGGPPFGSARRNNVTMPEVIEDYWGPRRNIAP